MKKIILIGSLVLSSSVFANDMLANTQVVLGVNAGPAWLTGNKSQTFFITPDVEKHFTGGNKDDAFPAAEIFVGLQKSLYETSLKQPLLAQLGLTIAGAGNAEFQGDIWDDADPTFNNSTYDYKINHSYVGITGRLIGDCLFALEPYISASLGVGFNHAYRFTVTPTIPEEVPAPPFGSNTKTSFSYMLGVGLQKSFTPHWQGAIGYEFADWGKMNLSRATGQTTNQGLSLNHLYANELQISLFYTV